MDNLLDHATTFTFVPAGTNRADLDTRHFRVKAEWRGDDNWVIAHSLGLWNGTDWEYEPTSSGYTDDFIARTRFTREQACTMAQQLADTVELDGLAWTGWTARRDTVRASAGQ
jgi:hypothetical protein